MSYTGLYFRIPGGLFLPTLPGVLGHNRFHQGLSKNTDIVEGRIQTNLRLYPEHWIDINGFRRIFILRAVLITAIVLHYQNSADAPRQLKDVGYEHNR